MKCYRCNSELAIDGTRGWCEFCKFWIESPEEPRIEGGPAKRMAVREEIDELEKLYLQ